ncbi:MAG TPA: response regulator [Candidatus Saccharimonadales bacterium]|nr:response regulator [Candidatus Saccharimonadales bacterium]
MKETLRLLLVEDSEDDALFLLRTLRKAEFELVTERVESESQMRAALAQQSWDIVISDFVIPGFGGLAALQVLRGLELDLPFIIVSGHIGEDIAVNAMKAGAHDYVMKDKLARLVPAVRRELAEAEVRRARKKAEQELAAKAVELERHVEQLRATEEELRQKNEHLRKASEELEGRVRERTADLSAALAELRRHITERQRLENELLEITENERQRIGLDLHDDLGQHLHGIGLMMEALHMKLIQRQSDLAPDVNKIKNRLSKAISYTHDLAHDLASLELRAKDLKTALNDLVTHIEESFEISCEFKLQGEIPTLPPNTVEHLYKIAQEAATNAIKHAQGELITFDVCSNDGTLSLKIQNDGRPFPADIEVNDRMGLKIMKYRAHVLGGTFAITTEQGLTTVACAIPTSEAAAAASQAAGVNGSCLGAFAQNGSPRLDLELPSVIAGQ